MQNKKQLVESREIYHSRDGREFNLNSKTWRLNKNASLAIGWVSRLEPILAHSLRKALARCAEEYAAETAKGLNDETRRYFNTTGDTIFDVDSIISFRSTLSRDQEYRLAKIRLLVRNLCDWGFPGVSKDVIKLLDSWRLKGIEKGKAIKQLDPQTGPLTDVEMSGLLDNMRNAYVSGKLTLADYAMAALFVYTGRRPIQITSLKIKDLCCCDKKDSVDYWIEFPRAKQRFQKWREQSNSYPITEELWMILDLHSKKVTEKISKKIGIKLKKQTLSELPLFPDYKTFVGFRDDAQLKQQLATDFHHIERSHCSEVMRQIQSQLEVYSERTGKLLNLETRRFRYTLGSNLAREGKGELIIAEALDHSDTQHVGVYVRNLPDVVERIDKAVALQLAPLAQAFQGVLINSEEEAIRGGDLNSRIGNGKYNVGNCGSYGFCGAMAPIACYTCKHFQPWVDGPHEIILDELLAKRDEVLKNTDDIKIASTNDRLILAVTQVIKRCEVRKAEAPKLELTHG